MNSELESCKINPRLVSIAESALNKSANERELIETLINTVKVFPNKKIEIIWKISDFETAR